MARNFFSYRTRRATDGEEFSVPTVPKADALAAAIESGFVSLPGRCASACGLELNLAEPGSKGAQHWFGRASQLLDSEVEDEATGPDDEGPLVLCSSGSMRASRSAGQEAAGGAIASCVRRCDLTWVVMAHGSSGMVYTNWRVAAKLATLGRAMFAPDSFALPPELGLRHRAPVEPLSKAQTGGEYWAANVVYETKCGWDAAGGKYPFCYSTAPENVIAEPAKWREYYERVFLIRKRELDYFVAHPPAFIGQRSRLFLMGQSEGGMLAARYYHPALEARLAGRIVAAWSCEHNYYVGSQAGAALCGGRCDPSVPVLNIIGSEDEFFSVRNFSVASRIAAGGAALPPKAGHCLAAFQRQRLEGGAVTLLRGAKHDWTLSHDSATQLLLRDFFESPSKFARGGSSALAQLCRVEAPQLFDCGQDGVQDPRRPPALEGAGALGFVQPALAGREPPRWSGSAVFGCANDEIEARGRVEDTTFGFLLPAFVVAGVFVFWWSNQIPRWCAFRRFKPRVV